MKNLIGWFLLCLCLLFIITEVDALTRYSTLSESLRVKDIIYTTKLNELEKEIRLLKQDLYTLEHKYETEETDNSR